MVFREFIGKNYDETRNLVSSLISNKEDVDDLYHSIIEQLINKDTDVTEKEWTYYLIRIIKNNYYSKNSRYYYEFKKPLELNNEIIDDIEYTEEGKGIEPSLEWVYGQLENYFWYDRDLFSLWLELGTIMQIADETKIPYGTVGKQIREIKKRLNDEWLEYLRCNE